MIRTTSTSCRYDDWVWRYHRWLPHWFERHVIVMPLLKRHKRCCLYEGKWQRSLP